MTESSPEQGAEQWKKKYYDQLDRLDQKEEEWSKLESVLKRAIGRLSLAAEGHNSSIDRHIKDVRTAIKDKINRHRLDTILDDLSNLLAKIEEKQAAPDKQTVSSLLSLIEALSLPAQCDKAKKKLIKRLNKASDDASDSLVKESVELLKLAITSDANTDEKNTGFFDRLLGSGNKPDKAIDFNATATLLGHVIGILPWPDELTKPSKQLIEKTAKTKTDQELSKNINQLESLINNWKEIAHVEPVQSVTDSSIESPTNVSTEKKQDVDGYRDCLLSFLDKLDNSESPSGQLAAFRTVARDAKQKTELDKLSTDLAKLFSEQRLNEQKDASVGTLSVSSSSQPSIQELLIRLLEQLLVPTDLQADVDNMKHRLESETEPADWKSLLKDVALLINSIRSRMQQEKHEFEDFLQQITGRLKELDDFLQTESDSLQVAEKEGKAFDHRMSGQVNDIREDVTQATDLSSLKSSVETKLEVISQHIIDYRSSEDKRLQLAQDNLQNMQSRMISLEDETTKLKQVIVEKNKQAMFDVLTGIPNRLAYEKKTVEEIARWKRFDNPLSLAVWDVDFFKKVNDTYGHKAGDKVLRTIAQLLNERIRATDFLARYGGEEFVMLLPGTKEEETLRLVNDLREKVEACGFHYHGDPVNITVSCGVSSFHDKDTLEKVFERADQALYKAKRNGRNQCVVASCLS